MNNARSIEFSENHSILHYWKMVGSIPIGRRLITISTNRERNGKRQCDFLHCDHSTCQCNAFIHRPTPTDTIIIMIITIAYISSSLSELFDHVYDIAHFCVISTLIGIGGELLTSKYIYNDNNIAATECHSGCFIFPHESITHPFHRQSMWVEITRITDSMPATHVITAEMSTK